MLLTRSETSLVKDPTHKKYMECNTLPDADKKQTKELKCDASTTTNGEANKSEIKFVNSHKNVLQEF